MKWMKRKRVKVIVGFDQDDDALRTRPKLNVKQEMEMEKKEVERKKGIWGGIEAENLIVPGSKVK